MKYPPNPPAVGDPDTLAYRQRLYFIVIVATFAVLVGALHLLGRLRAAGWPEHRRLAAVVVSVVVVLSAVYALLPGAPDPVPMPATLLWRYRLASLSGNLVLWAVLTLGFGLAVATHSQREIKERSASPSR